MKESPRKEISQSGHVESKAAEKTYGKISLSEAKEALLRSGYILEHRVENLLRDKEWYVETNSPYRDHETLKSRELDVYAAQVHEIGKRDGIFTATILAECVNNSQPLAFITKEDKFSEFFSPDIKLDFGLDESFYQNELQTSLANYLGINEFHHYCIGRVATQYCSFVRKDKGKPTSEWMATHDENHFGCFTTLIHALERHLEREKASFIKGWVNGIIIYPMLILQGDLLDIRIDGKDLKIESVPHIKYRRSIIWNGEETGYVIDVVTEAGLPAFLITLEEEIARSLSCIRSNFDILAKNTKDTILPRKSGISTDLDQ